MSQSRAGGGNVMGRGDVTQTRVVIVGAGFSGVGLGIGLKDSGLNDFVILEKSDCVGGVWRENRYPGAACDVPAHLYSFSFEPRANWPQKYASQADILDYLAHCTQKYDLEPHIRFGAEVTDARWDETSSHWIVRTGDGRCLRNSVSDNRIWRAQSSFLPAIAGPYELFRQGFSFCSVAT